MEFVVKLLINVIPLQKMEMHQVLKTEYEDLFKKIRRE